MLSGAVSPCGRLTDTWANRDADYPCARFGAAEGLRREYREGIYVGYRWFDTAGERVRYCFGFGLSYTRFALELLGGTLRFAVRVTNAGERPGREVVQLYASCPQGVLPKELRRLAAFGKTRTPAPGEEREVLRLEVPLEALASFDEAESRFVLEVGEYRFCLGESLDDARAVCLALLEETAAMVRGVQSVPGCGATIKHFAANNWETHRMHTDSAVSERALRELYLRGFEIAVRESRPAAIMTSYNKLNGTHAANSRDLCTRLARGEWGFDGLIMTDWYTTVQSPDCSASGCIRAGNDLIMPGTPGDLEDLRAALADGSVSLEELRQCAARILRAALRSRG